MSFYNTINLTGPDLQEKQMRAEAVESLVHNVFKEYKGYKLKAFDVEQILISRFENINHDSVKRAITDLANDKKLVKSARPEARGPYGRPVYIWTLKEETE